MKVPPKRLLMIWAHPDDEAYLAAGLAGRTTDAGGVVRCLTATHGEAGFPADDVRPAVVRRVQRARELRRSLAAVGVDQLLVLGHTDGACDQIPEEIGVSAIARQIRVFEPDLVVTFEPQGITLHPDHIAVSRWTTRAWLETGIGELLYAAHTESYDAEFGDLNTELGVYIGDRRPVPTPEAEVALDLELSPDEVERKRAALAAHASQTDGIVELMGEAQYRRWWRRETFRSPRADDLAAVAPSDSLSAAAHLG